MSQRTVLLVDDEQQILDTYSIILAGEDLSEQGDLELLLGLTDHSVETEDKREQFNLLTATQGLQALELHQQAIAAGTPPGVAVVDKRMPPGINGLETGIRLRQQDQSIHIIIITAYSNIDT